MRFVDKVRNISAYPEIRIKEGQKFPGVDVVFFERDGGSSKDRRVCGKLIGAYAGLNAFTVAKRAFPPDSIDLTEYMRAVAKNIGMATDYMGTNLKQLTLLESRYGKGDGPHVVNKSVLEHNKFDEILLSETPDSEEIKIKKRAGDVIMTDDPDTPIAIVGADAHPIAIKASKPDGSPVVCLVVGSHQGLLQYGVMQKAIDAMCNVYKIKVETVRIDIGPGLGPTSINGYKAEDGGLSSTSYEVGMDLAQKYIAASQEAQSPYYGKSLKFFDSEKLSPENFKTDQEYWAFTALAGSKNHGNPIFRAHPFDTKKCVINIEALVKQTAALSGVKAEKIVSVGEGNFFSARTMVKQLDIEALARAHARVKDLAKERGMTPEEFLSKPENTIYRNDGIGRNIFIAKVLDVLRAAPGDTPPVVLQNQNKSPQVPSCSQPSSRAILSI